MFIECLSTGMFNSNCYIVWQNQECVIIDAGVSSNEVLQILKKNDLIVKYILITHGHADHIYKLDELVKATSAHVLIHQDDSAALNNANYNMSNFIGTPYSYLGDFKSVKDGDVFYIDEVEIKIIHTPGHSRGGMCIKIEDVVFTGDTLFNDVIGRTDLWGGDYNQLVNSIKSKLLVLDSKTKVYPGHGKDTTIAYEKENNPYLK